MIYPNKITKNQFFVCQCTSDEHTLRFDFDPEYHEISTSVYLKHFEAWYKRIWIAIKYIFGYKSRFGAFDCFMFDPNDADRMIEFMQKIKENTKLS